MKTFYGPVPNHSGPEIDILHHLDSENLVSVTVWHLPKDGYGEGIKKQQVMSGVVVLSPQAIRLVFAGGLKSADKNVYEVGIVAA